MDFYVKKRRVKLSKDLRKVIIGACVFAWAVLMISCGESAEEVKAYDPAKATTLKDFYPTEGKFKEKVILTGTNLPTDPDMVRVYFNQRRAPVIGGTTERMYVMAPRLPGDDCVISVVIEGKDSLVYNNIFKYEESITVTTVAGNGDQVGFQEGPLASAILQPRYICCDNQGNVFISNWRHDDNRDNCYLCRLNEEENVFTRLSTTRGETNIPCCDPETGIMSVAIEQTIGAFITANPNEYWAPRQREMKFTNGQPAQYGWKHCMVVNPTDGFLYVRWYQGPIVRINQTTYEAYIIATSEQGDSYGLTFRPSEPNILYISFWGNAGPYSRSIVTVDVSAGKDLEATDPEAARAAVQATMQRVSSPSTGGGHRDGPLATAQFGQIGQIYCDLDGFIYVADYDNHCIRRITPENQVETVLGIPGQRGWKDGTRDEALFYNPRGIAIAPDGSVYVADAGNSRIRKLSVN
jgi:hypothetical protein